MRSGAGRLEAVDRDIPKPGRGQILVKVGACAVCRTDLHVVDGELPEPKIPVVPGHEIIGRVEEVGADVETLRTGDRVGVPWLGYSCGVCEYCRAGRENLCPRARFTGYQIDGGYAEYTVADARYAFALTSEYDATYTDAQAAPLMCAGLIGYRAYRLAGTLVKELAGKLSAERAGEPPGKPAGEGRRLGIYGFGAAAHIVLQIARHDGLEVYAFTSPGDEQAQRFARRLGAVWAGTSVDAPPDALDAALIFAPVGPLVPEALSRVKPGGTVVCAGIHMSDIPSFPYRLLWQERVVRSVANLTRQDAREFLALAPRVPVRTEVHPYPLAQANQALDDLRNGRISGAAVLVS